MSMRIIFPDTECQKDVYSFCYVEKILPDHRKLKKKVSIENLISALNDSMKKEKKFVSLGMLPKNFLDVKVEEMSPFSAEIFLYLPEKNRRIMYEETAYNIPFPNMIMKITVDHGKIRETKVFCVMKDLTYELAKKAICNNQRIDCYNYPFGNVSLDGAVCWGTNSLPDISSVHDVEIIPSMFFDAPTNADYYTADRTKLNYENIRKLYEELAEKNVFPYEILTKQG